MENVRFPNAFAVVAGNTPEAEIDALRGYFPHVIPLPPDGCIDEPVAFHPDMLFAVVGDSLVTHRRYYEAARGAVDQICALGGFSLVLSDMPRGPVYPADIGFNGLVYGTPAGTLLLGNTKHLAPEVLSLAATAGMEVVFVKQGYAACTVLAVPAVGLAATADRGLAEALEARGVHVVRLPMDAGISLPGYNCGFIGGSSGVWGRTVFFSGDPSLHAGLTVLSEALAIHGVETVVLAGKRLTDRGGIRIFGIRG